jgi:acid phosphatase family membrane protein YuiD
MALTLLILGFIYQLFILYDTLAQRNFIQVIGLCAYSGCLCVYTILQIDEVKLSWTLLFGIGDIPVQTWSSVRSLLTAISVITGVSTILLCGSSWKLYGEFQWTIV